MFEYVQIYVRYVVLAERMWLLLCVVFLFFQAEDGIRVLVRSRGLGDVYKRQVGSGLAYNRLFLAWATVVATRKRRLRGGLR